MYCKSCGYLNENNSNYCIVCGRKFLSKEDSDQLQKALQLIEKKEYTDAYEMLQQLAQQGVVEALFHVGECYYNGWGTIIDYGKAFTYYEKSSKYEMDGNVGLAKCYLSGNGTGKDYKTAFRLFEMAAESGHAYARYEVGMAYRYGCGTERNIDKALEQYRKAAEHNQRDAIYYLGRCYQYGQGVAKDLKKAYELYEKAAELGSADARFMVVRCYEEEWGIERNYKKDFELLKKTAELGSAYARVLVGRFYYEGLGVELNYEKAVEQFRKAADKNERDAIYILATCYQNGKGITKDLEKAFELYEKAAELRNLDARYMVGRFYEEGWGVEQNYKKAVEQYQKAAEQNQMNAIYNLARCYHRGNGIDKDLKKAFELYEKAAKLGHADARNKVGRFYEEGWGIEQDYEKAVEQYRKAAEQNHMDAIFNLGMCYRKGNGVAKDLKKAFELHEKAFELYEKAAELGNAYERYMVGRCYREGYGVEKDDAKAVANYRVLFKNDYSFALQLPKEDFIRMANYLGDYYNNKEEKNVAIQFYKLAALKKDEYASGMFLKLYELLHPLYRPHYDNISNDNIFYEKTDANYYVLDDKACEIYFCAAKDGDARGKLRVGINVLYFWDDDWLGIPGTVIDINRKEAIEYIKEAAQAGLVPAKFFLLSMADSGQYSMSDDQYITWMNEVASDSQISDDLIETYLEPLKIVLDKCTNDAIPDLDPVFGDKIMVANEMIDALIRREKYRYAILVCSYAASRGSKKALLTLINMSAEASEFFIRLDDVFLDPKMIELNSMS